MGGTWRTVAMCLGMAGVSLAYVGTEAVQRSADDRGIYYTVLTAVGVGVFALWLAFAKLGRHFRDVDRLRDDLGSMRGRGEPSEEWTGRSDGLGRLAVTLAETLRRERRGGGRGDERLAAVIAAVEEPLLVLQENGAIAAMNRAAGHLLGAEVAPGRDVYELLDRPELFRAIERARGAGEPVSAVLRLIDGTEMTARVADLGLNAGAVLAFPQRGEPRLPPVTGRGWRQAGRLDEEAALGALPLVALWVATTAPVTAPGGGGRVIGVGTVRLSGARIFRTVSLDLLIDPGEPVPAEATAVHGISTAMVQGVQPFAAAWPAIAEALRNAVVVGFGVEAALAVLAEAMERAGLPAVEAPPALDVGRLAVALEPSAAGLGPAALAAAFGVEHPDADERAPHALLAAELAAVLIRRLDERGMVSLREARALAAGAVPS